MEILIQVYLKTIDISSIDRRVHIIENNDKVEPMVNLMLNSIVQ